MKKSQQILITALSVIILIIGLGLVVYVLAPVHELFHAIPCKLAGLSPDVSYFKVVCNGIQEKSNATQFFYFIGPYLFDVLLLTLCYFYIKTNKIIKYLFLLPALDVIVNYVQSRDGSDFSFLLRNTYPNLIPFFIGVSIALFVLLFTVFVIRKYGIKYFTKELDSLLEKIKK